jgi:predicted transposase YbfD/YdcC
VKEAKGELVVQLKANQEFLCHKIEQITRRNGATDIFQETEKNRNRIETRTVTTFKLTKQLLKYSDGWDEYLKACVQVHRVFETYDTTEKTWKISEETSLYVSSMLTTAPNFAAIIRKHWGTENSNHYVKDVILDEDNSRIRNNPSIFAKLRSFALNVMRANNVKNIRTELFTNCCNMTNVVNYQYLG